MPVSTETRNVLEEMRKAGVDPAILASLERDIDSKPNADAATKNMLLAQASFNTYRSKKDEEIKELKENLTKLSSLQGAATNLTGDLQTAAIEQIAALEKLFEDQGFDIEEVRAEAAKLVSNPDALKTLVDKKEEKVVEKEKVMPNPSDSKDYVDKSSLTEILTGSLSNMAAGGINMATHIARAMREADKLGIELDDAKLDGFAPAFIKGLEANKDPKQIADEYFGFSTVRAEKDKLARDAELAKARQEGAQEALKSAGVTIRKTTLNRKDNPNPILDRKRIEKPAPEEIKLEDLPKNEKGDPEYFRLRRFDRQERRAAHTENAVNRFEEVSQDYDDDGLYIGNRAQA